MELPLREKGFIISVVFICLILLLWVFIEVLPLWLTDPYTYTAYRQSKRLVNELNFAVRQSVKINGISDSFSDFSTLDERRKREYPHMVSFAPLIKKGIKVGKLDRETQLFIPNTLEGSCIEIRWDKQHVTAQYRLGEQTVTGWTKAIFTLGKVIDEPIAE